MSSEPYLSIGSEQRKKERKKWNDFDNKTAVLEKWSFVYKKARIWKKSGGALLYILINLAWIIFYFHPYTWYFAKLDQSNGKFFQILNQA